MLLTQAYYQLVPAKPSPAVLRLQKEASRKPRLTENGFRLAGLLAPAGWDPVAFGRCLFPDAEKLEAMPFRDPEYSPSSRKEDETRRVECLKGRPALTLPPAIVEAKAGTDLTLTDWIALGEEVPTPELLERARQVWAAGPRSLGADSSSPTPDSRTLSKLAQWRAAHAIQLWQSDSRAEALAIWATSGEQALMASSGLMETMVSVSELSRVLMGMQMNAQSSAPIDHQEASALFKIVALADQMPDLVRNAMISEWQMVERDLRSTYQVVLPKTPENSTFDQAMFLAGVAIFRDITFDPVDTVNRFTADFENKRNQLVALGNGEVQPLKKITRACEWMGAWALLCRPYERNPVGRFFVSLSSGDYTAYGTSVADLRNLAAATRLTIEAHRQGLQSEALTRFVASAPENMRDIFTQQPFAYDPAQRRLTIELREKSTVLGEGSYSLPL